jgi:hypothetical protein
MTQQTASPVPSAPSAVVVDLTVVGGLQIAGVDFVLTGSAGTNWQFSGRTAPGASIALGQLAQQLAAGFGTGAQLPAPLAGLTVSDLSATYNLSGSSLTLGCTVDLPVGDGTIEATVGLRVRQAPDGSWSFAALLEVASLEFDLAVGAAAGGAGDLVVATYRNTGPPGSQDLVALVASFSPDLAALVPPGLSIELSDVVLVYRSAPAGSVFLLAVDLDVSGVPALTALPLVGPLLPASDRIALTALRVLVATGRFETPLPAGTPVPIDVPVDAGVTLAGVFDVTGQRQVLTIPLGVPGTAGQPGPKPPGPTPPAPAPPVPPNNLPVPTPAATPAAPDGTKWINLQKSFGPVHLNRIGISFHDRALLFLIDGALNAAGLTLALDGLGFGSPLDHFDPIFQLRGLGVQYEQGPVEIGGAFLRLTRTEDGVTYDEYDGAAILKTPPFSLTAFGSYAYYKGQPSLFVYAVLDYPLGGPTFFFVTGLAGGFGYNRALHVPGVDTLASFPLVSAATGGASAPAAPATPGTPATGTGTSAQNGLLGILQQLENTNAIPPSLGDFFFALGIKFTSFEILDGFLLLTVAFGHTLEIDLLGLATLILPTPEAASEVTPLAEIQLAVKASFLPEQGYLGVAAQLTPASFLLSRDCHLTGGFAFSAWFAGPHAGDFVTTLGGYHPQFPVPSHYPTVPRLGFSWQINDEISIKGGGYYALTASAAMAGAALQATWHSGNLSAWFNFAADFIIGWKPLHYDARLTANFGVRYTFEFFGTHSISVDLSADLHLWGPEFTGTAHLHLSVVSFDIAFGASASQAPQPLSWDGGDASFSGSFLPAGSVCGVAVTSGLLTTFDDPAAAGGTQPAWVVNPLEVAFTTNSLVPSSSAVLGTTAVAHQGNTAIGIAPMDLSRTDIATKQTITITRDGVPAEQDFALAPVLKPMPSALWGESIDRTPTSPLFVDSALAGFTVTPAQPPTPGATALIPESELDFVTTDVVAKVVVPVAPSFASSAAVDAARRAAVRASVLAPGVVAAREGLLAALGFGTAALTVDGSVADVFVEAPQVSLPVVSPTPRTSA